MLETTIRDLREQAEEHRSRIALHQSQIDQEKAELNRIEKAIRVLDPTIGEARSDGELAGFAAEVAELLRTGPKTKAEISRLIGGHRSRATYALGVLIERGMVRPAGSERDRSKEYVLVESLVEA